MNAVSEFKIGPAEKRAGLVRQQRNSEPPGDAEFANLAAKEFGYQALKKKLASQNVSNLVMETLREVGAPAPLLQDAVEGYKQRCLTRANRFNRLKVCIDLMLLATFSPLTTVSLLGRYYDLDRVQKTMRLGDDPPVFAIIILSCLGWFVWDVTAWAVAWDFVVTQMGFQVGGVFTPLLAHLGLSLLLTPVSIAALSRLLGIREFEGSSWLRRRREVWQKKSIDSYGSNIPKRVLENAMLIKKSLIEKGANPTFTVEALQPARDPIAEGALQEFVQELQRRKAWLRDPFLILEVAIGNEKLQVTVDYWDEKEFDPEYAW